MKVNTVDDYTVNFFDISNLSCTHPISLELHKNVYTDFNNNWKALYIKFLSILYFEYPGIINGFKNKSFTSGRMDISDINGYYSMLALENLLMNFMLKPTLVLQIFVKRSIV